MFRSVYTIRKLAARKGYTVERSIVLKGKTYVRLIDPRGQDIDAPRTIGFTLREAERVLEGMPDRQ